MEGGERWQSKERKRREDERGEEGEEMLRRAATRWKQRSAVGVTQLFFSQPAKKMKKKKKKRKKKLRSESGADKTATPSTAEANALNSFVQASQETDLTSF